MCDVSYLMADNPFQFFIRGLFHYSFSEAYRIETKGDGIGAGIPVTVQVQFPFNSYLQEQSVYSCLFISGQWLETFFFSQEPDPYRGKTIQNM
ncbi:hypothetical protein GCM10007084_21670 [Parabacteroides faecis]|nr:hypothetical protein GCM10007084_21670 [Parabacteroides faecis]